VLSRLQLGNSGCVHSHYTRRPSCRGIDALSTSSFGKAVSLWQRAMSAADLHREALPTCAAEDAAHGAARPCWRSALPSAASVASGFRTRSPCRSAAMLRMIRLPSSKLRVAVSKVLCSTWQRRRFIVPATCSSMPARATAVSSRPSRSAPWLHVKREASCSTVNQLLQQLRCLARHRCTS
jgi:hypothetical protein